MKIIQLEVGNLGVNCYIVYCEQTRKAVIIDPGGDAAAIIGAVNQEGLQVEHIINTHGHADHIAANDAVKQATGATVLIHTEDADMLINKQLNLSAFMGPGFVCSPANRLLQDGENIECGTVQLQILHTPGHTPGGISLKTKDAVFSGDTLFAESVGRTDFPGGSYNQLVQSIQDKLMVLPDEMTVYPGHGPQTTIGWERKMNPFIR
ncbi:MBL fold metallo-hydrolase [Acetonema longum]|uniref:Hydroxyacylglutathione hydrolase n=1 Tax=Acetonema longum DSM 6540 TaxID=1009370 RepID=F7NPM6_9FIRM|nr:MBL fold metallo-hydrolase [Acetonema longum]EGO61993.1 Hydroxyacylglutathione hydrolase [Acetonema longum DSM 6540]